MKAFVGFCVLLLILPACTSREEKARALYNQALTAQREGKPSEAQDLLNRVAKDYPETEVATQANQALNQQKSIFDFLGGSLSRVNEQAGIANLRTINTSSITFLASRGGRYPKNSDELVKADLIDSRYLMGLNGYRFT